MMVRRTPDEIFQHVQLILRRDLKLGDAAPISRQMPFFGGEVDLDSLDILLLVTSIEKELGVKIPSDVVGREVFQNVGTLVDYVEQHQADSDSGAEAPKVGAPAGDLLDRLPHREPFRFISEISSIEPGRSAQGIWSVTGSEDLFRGHFPGRPVVPGVLLAEALAQLSGLAGGTVGAGNGGAGMLVHVDIRFEAPVAPPARIVLQSKCIGAAGALQKFEVSASVNGQVVARGMLALQLDSTGEAR